jgi:hypothetical protein
MIDLARKDEYSIGLPVPAEKAPEPRVSYPNLTITCEEPQDIPEGEFMAEVKLRTTRTEVSKDENGKQRCVYSFDVVEMEPGECTCDENEGDETPEDAVTSMTKAMISAKNKKLMGDE